MATQITDEQRLALRKSPRFEDMTRASVANYAQYIHEQSGDAGSTAGLSPKVWALTRFIIAEPIINILTNKTSKAGFLCSRCFVKV